MIPKNGYVQINGKYYLSSDRVLDPVTNRDTLSALQNGTLRSTTISKSGNATTSSTSYSASSHGSNTESSQTSKYIQIQGTYFENQNGAYMAVGDSATLHGLKNGQIEYETRDSLDGIKLVTPSVPTRTTSTSVSRTTSTAATVRSSTASANTAASPATVTSAMSDSDKRWLSYLPTKYQSEVLSLSPAEITAKKNAGTWVSYQRNIASRAEAEAQDNIKRQVVIDTITGLPKAAKDVTTGCIQGTGQAVTTLGEFDNPVTATNTYTSSLARGDGKTAGQVLCKNIGSAAIAVAPVGKAATVGTRAVRVVEDAASAERAAKTATTLNSTGRTAALNLTEQLAMKQAMSKPLAGIVLDKIVLVDQRWPSSAGWVKMVQNINGVEIHYVRNKITGATADWKFAK